MTASLTATDRNITTPRLRAPWQSPQCTEPLLLPILSSFSPAKRCTTPLRPAVASPRHDHSPPATPVCRHCTKTPQLAGQTPSLSDANRHCTVCKVHTQVANIHTQLAFIYSEVSFIYSQLAFIFCNRRQRSLCAVSGKFMCGVREVYVRCPGSLPALPAGLQTVTAGNMCIAGRVADRSAALARRRKKPGNGRMWIMPPAVQRAGFHGMDIMHRDTGLRQDDRRLSHGTTACLNSICVAVCAAYFVTASSNRSMVTGHCSPVTISLSVMVPAASSSLPTMTTNGMCLVSA